MVYRSPSTSAYQLPQSLPTVTQLANDVQITNCHRAYQLPQSLQLANSYFSSLPSTPSFPLQIISGHTSPVIISDDDDLVAVSELFARADPASTAVAATAVPAAGTHKRQISEAVPRDERPNRPETTSAAPPQQEAFWGGVPRRPRRQIQTLAQAITLARVAGPGSPNGVIEMQLQSNYSANGA
jgi:hypothetical protein